MPDPEGSTAKPVRRDGMTLGSGIGRAADGEVAQFAARYCCTIDSGTPRGGRPLSLGEGPCADVLHSGSGRAESGAQLAAAGAAGLGNEALQREAQFIGVRVAQLTARMNTTECGITATNQPTNRQG